MYYLFHSLLFSYLWESIFIDNHTNKKLILSIFVLAGAPVLLSAAGEARLLRFPATNGKEIVFSYAGDLYKVHDAGGEAQRLTSNVGYEMYPRFSPYG